MNLPQLISILTQLNLSARG